MKPCWRLNTLGGIFSNFLSLLVIPILFIAEFPVIPVYFSNSWNEFNRTCCRISNESNSINYSTQKPGHKKYVKKSILKILP